MNQPMKYAIVLPDGAADEPVEQLGGRTPLEAAKTPNIDWVSVNGRQGRVVTVPQGFAPASDVATLSLFGYDPRVDYPGRAPFEAVARGITVRSDQLVFRCNLVTIVDGCMEDFTAGHISQAEAAQLIADLNEQVAQPTPCGTGSQPAKRKGESRSCRFTVGMSYRNLMVASGVDEVKVVCTPPHDIPGQPVADHLPRGAGADWVREIMEQAHALLREHEVNMVRSDLGENAATHIWLWGHGRPRKLEPFVSRFGVKGALIGAVDLVRGIAKSVGMELLDVVGATGYLDTDYAAKGAAAVEAVESFDLTIVHIEAPDEAGHLGDADAKVEAIERIDEHIVGPVLEKLRTCEKWKILIAPDHPTPVASKVHSAVPPPFCLAGHTVHPVLSRPFSETSAAKSDLQIDPGHELMEFFLRA